MASNEADAAGAASSEATAAPKPVVFKASRNRGNIRKRERGDSGDERPASASPAPAGAAAGDEAGSAGPAAAEEDTPEVVAARLAEARALQKYRRREAGISADLLGRTDPLEEPGAAAERKRSVKEDIEERINSGGGLVSGATKGLGASFTQQSKLDADQQMIDYIEREMKKRKGIVDEAQPAQTKDMLAELYTIPEHLRTERMEQPEGPAIPISGGILAMIPEVDLGIQNKLQNIEETERAKALLLEKRKLAASERRVFDPNETLTGSEVMYARTFRQGRGPERTEVVTNPYANWVVRELTGGDWREGRATDDLVLSRFRAREMMFFRGRGRGRK